MNTVRLCTKYWQIIDNVSNVFDETLNKSVQTMLTYNESGKSSIVEISTYEYLIPAFDRNFSHVYFGLDYIVFQECRYSMVNFIQIGAVNSPWRSNRQPDRNRDRQGYFPIYEIIMDLLNCRNSPQEIKIVKYILIN